MRLTDAQRRAAFGMPTDNSVVTTVTTPWGLRVTVHRLIEDVFLAACHEAKAKSEWTPRRIDSHVDRQIRGSSSWSLHAYALAFDFFDRPFPLPVDVWGPTNAPDRAFREAFERFGFFCGANFSGRKDWPHIEWAASPPGPVPKPPEEDVLDADGKDYIKNRLALQRKHLQGDIAKALESHDEEMAGRIAELVASQVDKHLRAEGDLVRQSLRALAGAVNALLAAAGSKYRLRTQGAKTLTNDNDGVITV